MRLTRGMVEDLPLLRFLPPSARALVVDSFVLTTYKFGQPIVKEGEPADALYVIVSGRARVLKTGENGEELPLNTLKAGDSFGEIGLLEQTTRTATVRASGDVEVMRLDRSVFDALVRTKPEIRHYFQLQVKHRTLHNFFREFTPFASLPVEALEAMLSEMVTVVLEPKQLIIRQGDEPGPMYIVEDGRLRVYVEEKGQRRYLAYLRKGDYFGEMSVFKHAPRSASVEAVSPCRLLMLTKDAVEKLIESSPEFRQQIEQHIAQYDYKHVARVPLDFADEILPADIRVAEKVGRSQVDSDHTMEFEATPAPGDGNGAKGDAAVARRLTPAAPAPAKPAGPFATTDGRFVKKPRRIRRFPHIHQIDEMDCGAASLAMICRHYGRPVSLSRIRQLAHCSLDGTSLRAITHAAQELGLAARSVKASPKNLAQMPLPAVVHWEGNHWIVLYDVADGYVKVADPASGLRKIPRAEFHEKWSGYAALFDYTDAFQDAPVDASSMAWLWPFFKPYMRLLAQAVGLALVVSVLEMVMPVFTQVIVDRVLVERDVGLLHLLIGGMGVVLVFMILATILQRYLTSWAATRIDSATLDFLTRRLLSLPMSYFNTRRTGDIQRRLGGMRQVRDFVMQNAVGAVMDLATLASALTLMIMYSPALTFAFLAVVPIYGGMMWWSAKFLRPTYDKLEEAFGKYYSYQIDAIKGIETVKSMGAESAFRELMLNQFNSVSRKRFKADFTMMAYDGTLQMVTFLTVAVFLWVGAGEVMAGKMTIGALVAFNSLVAMANGPIVHLLSMWDNFQMASILLNRLNDVFSQNPEQGHDRSKLIPVRTLEGRITIKHLGFRYGGPESPAILDDISVDIPPNTTVAIVGRSGSGKTTFIKLLSGLLEPTDGTILYDGVDLKTLNYRDLRRHIGFVLQENHLFDDTIARNIAFGEQEPDMDAVLWASRVANAHEFIERLPLGYETKIGESGLAISGGQKQRVAIARALYQRPPVLVFDEATSALDTESERAVKENMDKLLEGRTSFVIAHRLSTVRDADMILVLEKGRLVERGSHDELMDRQGLYYYLVSQQLGM